VLGPDELELEYPQEGQYRGWMSALNVVMVPYWWIFESRALYLYSTCDRSLDDFEHEIVCSYKVLFKQNDVEEEEDETDGNAIA
jgi:hypothetical protein